MDLAETLNRTIKLAMDEGRASSYEDAQRLFRSFRLRIVVVPGFSGVPAAEACVLTLLNAARKTFLGGVSVIGPLQELCTLAWFEGKSLSDVAEAFDIECESPDLALEPRPTIVVGANKAPRGTEFCLGVGLSAHGFTLEPDGASRFERGACIEAGVAAAGAAINEAFQHVYRGWQLAGARRINFALAAMEAVERQSIWLVGLGHVGQAYLWTLALSKAGSAAKVRLTDFDVVTRASLSTCLVVDSGDLGRKKVDAVAGKLEQVGFEVIRDSSKLSLDEKVIHFEEDVAVIAVDNIGLRRGLDRLRGPRVLECGIGDGIDGFTHVQMHSFPGTRLARDVWAGDDARASRPVDIAKPAYQALLRETGDECGTTLVANRSVATPFVGAFAGGVLAHISGRPEARDAWNFNVNCL